MIYQSKTTLFVHKKALFRVKRQHLFHLFHGTVCWLIFRQDYYIIAYRRNLFPAA